MRLLQEMLSRLPAQPAVVLWVPPRYVSLLPPPHTEEAQQLADCKASLRAWAEQRPHTALLDFAIDGPVAQARENFMDPHHPRRQLSAMIETDIAATFARLK
jgi:hypothetical protein